MMKRLRKISRGKNHRAASDEGRSPSRTGSPGKDVEMPFTRYHPYSKAIRSRNSSNREACSSYDGRSSSKRGSGDIISSRSNSVAFTSFARSSSSSSRESRDIYRLAKRLSEKFSIFTRNTRTQALKSSSPSNTRTQANTTAEKSPSRGSSGVPERDKNTPQDTDLAKLSTWKDDFLKCTYCGLTSRVGDFMDRMPKLSKPTARGVPPCRTLTPVRCKLCYDAFPVSPQAQPRIPFAAQQEKKLVAKEKLKIHLPTPKLSTLERTYKNMMEERRLQEEKEEGKKRERGTSRFVDRDVLLMKLHVRRAVLGEGNPGHEVTKGTKTKNASGSYNVFFHFS